MLTYATAGPLHRSTVGTIPGPSSPFQGFYCVVQTVELGEPFGGRDHGSGASHGRVSSRRNLTNRIARSSLPSCSTASL